MTAVRKYAVELEGYIDTNLRDETIYVGGCAFEVESDGSLNDKEGDYAVEVKPRAPLTDIESIRHIYSELHHYGWWTDEDAGLHVHVDAGDYTPKDFHKLLLFMTGVERLIYSITDEFRFVDSDYSYPLTNYENMVRDIVNKPHDEIQHMYQVEYAPGTRYQGLNFQSYSKHGTVEFRYFAPQTNAEMVVNYVELVTRIVDFVKNATFDQLAVITCKLYECDFREAANTLKEVLELPFNLVAMKENRNYESYSMDYIKYNMQVEMDIDVEEAM